MKIIVKFMEYRHYLVWRRIVRTKKSRIGYVCMMQVKYMGMIISLLMFISFSNSTRNCTLNFCSKHVCHALKQIETSFYVTFLKIRKLLFKSLAVYFCGKLKNEPFLKHFERVFTIDLKSLHNNTCLKSNCREL